MTKKYRLKQVLLMPGDEAILLPIEYEVVKKGDKYVGEGGWEFAFHGVENNKLHWEEVVEPEPERIEVRIVPNENYAEGKWLGWYVLETSKAIPRHKLDAIKEAIEKVLNPETELQSKEKDTLSRDWEITAYSGNGIFNIGDSMFEYAERAYAENMGVCIHSVRRLSDNTVWALKENTPYGEIVEFKITDAADSGMYVLNSKGGWICLSKYQKLPPKTLPSTPITREDMCNICGGTEVYIRGKYPNEDKRKVCPTCVTSWLDEINNISSNGYGQKSQSI